MTQTTVTYFFMLVIRCTSKDSSGASCSLSTVLLCCVQSCLRVYIFSHRRLDAYPPVVCMLTHTHTDTRVCVCVCFHRRRGAPEHGDITLVNQQPWHCEHYWATSKHIMPVLDTVHLLVFPCDIGYCVITASQEEAAQSGIKRDVP